jgi:hypothetical protein
LTTICALASSWENTPGDGRIALAATVVKGHYARRAKLDELFDRFGPHIDEVVASREACLTSLWPICRMSHKAFVRRLEQARRGPSAGARKPKAPKPVPTADEARRLDAIAVTRWPRISVRDFRRGLLRRHFPFVRGLLRENKITYKQARKLFRLTAKGITLRCFDFDNDLLELATGPRPGPKERQKYQALAVREYAAAPKQSLTALWKRLRREHRYPLDFAAFTAIIRSFAAGRYQGRLPSQSRRAPPAPLNTAA